MSLPSWVQDNVVAGFQAIVAELELISSQSQLNATISGQFILQVASAPAISASTPATLTPVTGLSAAMVALFNVIPFLVSPDTGTDPSLSQGIVALASGLVSAMDPTDAAAAFASAVDSTANPAEPAFSPATANRVADAANQLVIARFARMVYLSAYVQALVSKPWPLISDAITARAEAVTRFERELNLTGGGGEINIATAMIKLRNSVVNFLSTAIINAQPILEIQAPSMPAIWWAWRLYQNPAMAPNLIALNQVPTVEFMPVQFEAMAAITQNSTSAQSAAAMVQSGA
jgi:hypothetical protein